MFRNRKLLKKSILMLISSVILTASITACGAGGAKTSSISVSQVIDKVKQSEDLTQMKEGDAEKLKKLYGIDSAKLDGFALYTASSNIKADELLVVKVKDTKDIDDVKSKITDRVEKQSQSFKDYLPDEYSLIEKHVLKDTGDFILFDISKNSDKVEESFDAALK
jgi:cytidylate kinase